MVKAHLWAIIDEYADRQQYRPDMTQLSAALGISKQALSTWKAGGKRPTAENLRAVARVTGVPYLAVLSAVLRDTGYLIDGIDDDLPSSPTVSPAAVALDSALEKGFTLKNALEMIADLVGERGTIRPDGSVGDAG